MIGKKAADLEGINRLLTSKYAQANYVGLYREIRKYLECGRSVLMCGTPCQIAGLNSFLGRDYSELYTVDFICHGILSNGLWKKYLKEHTKIDEIKKVCMRDKSKEIVDKDGFYKSSMRIDYKDMGNYKKTADDDIFLSLFLSNALQRGSCYKCSFRGYKRKSDITLGDFHGKEMILEMSKEDDLGASLVFLNSKKGMELWDKVKDNFYLTKVSIDTATKYNFSYWYDFPIQYYTYYLDSIYENSDIKTIYDEYLNCRFRSDEKTYYWKKVSIAKCENRLRSIAERSIKGKYMIYGWSGLGEILYEKLEEEPVAVLDRNPEGVKRKGVDIFMPHSAEAEDALLKAAENKWVVIVTPITDGWSIMRDLKDRYPDTKIISITEFIWNFKSEEKNEKTFNVKCKRF